MEQLGKFFFGRAVWSTWHEGDRHHSPWQRRDGPWGDWFYFRRGTPFRAENPGCLRFGGHQWTRWTLHKNAGVQEASSRGENGQDCPELFGADKLACERCGIDPILFHGYFEGSMQFLQSLGFNLKDEVLQEISKLLEANGTWDWKEGCQQLWVRTQGGTQFPCGS